MKIIGLIGGMSWESSAEYYRVINQSVKAQLGGHHNATSLMATVDFQRIKDLQYQERWDEAGEQMAQAARRLQDGGADFIVLCTNTMHKVADAIEAAVSIPLLHIADATAATIRAAGLTRVGLLATAFTMEQEFYIRRLESHGIEVLVPQAEDRTRVHQVIYDELCHGEIKVESRRDYQDIIEELRGRGAQGVILGCTEITLLIKAEDSVLPVFDTTLIHCEAAVKLALSDMPQI